MWIHKQKLLGIFLPEVCPTDRQLADMNTKPNGGESLQKQFLYLMGARFYPPEGSKHYELLELGNYNINIHRGTFRKQDTTNKQT